MAERYARCAAITHNTTDKEIFVVGAGSTGSRVVLTLIKMGFENITVCDFDTVEDHNIASQVYDERHNDMLKVEALKEIAHEHNSNVELNIIRDPFDPKMEEFIEAELVVLSVDSMDVRKDIFNALEDGQMYIDTKMSGGYYEIIQGVKGVNDEDYLEKRWFPSDEADMPVCGGQASAFNSLIVAGRVCSRILAAIKADDELPQSLSDCSMTHIIAKDYL